jgi:hypothetical protein
VRLLRWKLSETRVIICEIDSSQASACGLSSFQKTQKYRKKGSVK